MSSYVMCHYLVLSFYNSYLLIKQQKKNIFYQLYVTLELRQLLVLV